VHVPPTPAFPLLSYHQIREAHDDHRLVREASTNGCGNNSKSGNDPIEATKDEAFDEVPCIAGVLFFSSGFVVVCGNHRVGVLAVLVCFARRLQIAAQWLATFIAT